MIPVESPSEELASLSNRLVTVEQLSMTSSRLDGISPDLEASIRHAGCCLTQQAGILLRLPQDIVAQAIVTFTRFYAGGEGGSFRVHAAKVCSRRRQGYKSTIPKSWHRIYQQRPCT